MTLKKMVTSVFNKFLQKITWRIYSQRHYPHQHLKSWYTTLECDDSENSNNVFIRGSRNIALKEYEYCTLFSLTMIFFHWVFLARFLMRQLLMYKNEVLFSSLEFFPSKVLTRHRVSRKGEN